jgi:hypothetical protein
LSILGWPTLGFPEPKFVKKNTNIMRFAAIINWDKDFSGIRGYGKVRYTSKFL